MVGAQDLNGLAVEPINEFPEGFVASLDNSLEGGLSLRMSMRPCKGSDELSLQVPPGGDYP